MKNLLAVSMGMVQKYGHKSAFLYSVMDNLYCEKMKAGDLDSNGWGHFDTKKMMYVIQMSPRTFNSSLKQLIRDGFVNTCTVDSELYFKANLDVMNRFLDEWESKEVVNSIG